MKKVWCYLTALCLAKCLCMASDIVPSRGLFNNSDTNTRNFHGLSCLMEEGKETVYAIKVPGLNPFLVLCNAQIAGPGYTVVASRSNVSVNFFRNWKEYKKGFGDLWGDFFIGLDKLHAITKSRTHELYIHLEDFEGNIRFARYDEFYIENENESYKMSKLGTYTGDAGDSLSYHLNEKFSTYDKDNDSHASLNCAVTYLGAWWHKGCHHSNLFGMYLGGSLSSNMENKGIVWNSWRAGLYSYKSMKMMVRPKCRCS